jgi:FkbM family methyltransferase
VPASDRLPRLPRSRTALRHYAAVSAPAFVASRLLDRLVRPRIYLGDHTLMTRTIFGHVLYLDTRDDSLLPALVLRGVWEPNVTRVMLRLLRPGMRVVEVGANVGYYTVLAASCVGPAGSVTAFEANPAIAERLRRAVVVNGYQWWTRVVESAVADREGEATLHVLARHQGSSSLARQGTDVLEGWGEVPHPLTVPVTTLDALLGPDPSPVDLLKIDAEGWEPAIFDGMRGVLARSPHLHAVIEFTPALVANAGRAPGAFLDTLAGLGFHIETIDARGRLRPATRAQLLATSSSELLLSR